MIPTYLRSNKVYNLYKKNRKNSLEHLKIVNDFKYWTIVKNEFPYDAVATRHDLLIPKREIQDIFGISLVEQQELKEIWKQLKRSHKYDFLLVPLPWSQTFKSKIHFHLLKTKIKHKGG